MNLPEIQSHEDVAINLVASIINKATEKLGMRQNLAQIAQSRDIVSTHPMLLSLTALKQPLAITSEKFIKDAIEKYWKLTEVLSYHMVYHGGSQDECSQYYYYEVIFSQPTAAYPVPQATVSVFFRVEDKHIEPPEIKGVPLLVFRIEGQHMEHDVRYRRLTADWILAVLQMKIKLFSRVERLKLF